MDSQFSESSHDSDGLLDIAIEYRTPNDNIREKLIAEIRELERKINIVVEKRFELQSKISTARKPKVLSRHGGPNSSMSQTLDQSTELNDSNAPLMDKLNLFKILSGLRISSYQDQPLRLIVEIHTSEVDTYYVAFNKTPYDTFTLGACNVPVTSILDKAKEMFTLSSVKSLSDFSKYVQRCCLAFHDRRRQLEEFQLYIEDRDYTVFNTCSIEYVDIGLPLTRSARDANVDKINLNLYYRLYNTLPFEMDVICSNDTLRQQLEISLRTLQCYPLTQAFTSIKEEPESSLVLSDVEEAHVGKKKNILSYNFESSGEDSISDDSDIFESVPTKKKKKNYRPTPKRFKRGAARRLVVTDSELSDSSWDERTPRSARGTKTVASQKKPSIKENQSAKARNEPSSKKNKSTNPLNDLKLIECSVVVEKSSFLDKIPTIDRNKSTVKNVAPVFLTAKGAQTMKKVRAVRKKR